MKIKSYFIFTLIVFNFLHSLIHTTHEIQHEERIRSFIRSFTNKQLEFVLSNDMNTFTIRRLLSVAWKLQLWKNQKEWLKDKIKEETKLSDAGRMISTFNINQLEFLMKNDINTSEMRTILIKEELDRQLLVEKEKRNENAKLKKSIWLIRHGEKDMTKHNYYMDIFKELNYEWSLSENGAVQSRRVAGVLREQYENAANSPHIFVSPFRRTVHTALYVASALNSKIQIEDGLVEKRHGLWTRTKMINAFSKHSKYFNTHYKSRFHVTKDITEPVSVYDDLSRSRILNKEFTFDENVAHYFVKMLREGNQDIIIIGHQIELYNIQSVITVNRLGFNRAECEKITCASMFQYVLNPISLKFELKSYFEGI